MPIVGLILGLRIASSTHYGGTETVHLWLITVAAPSAYAVRLSARFSHLPGLGLAEGAICDRVLSAGSSCFDRACR